MIAQKKETPMKHTTKVTAKHEIVTPDKAKAWLAATELAGFVNRSVREKHIRQLARAIKDGKWSSDAMGQGISLNGGDVVVDGQHRLLAVIRANKPIYTMVARGVDPATILDTDCGAPRRFADFLKMKGYSNWCNLAALASAVLRHEAEGRIVSSRHGQHVKPLNSEMWELITTTPALQTTVRKAGNRVNLAGRTNVAIVRWVATNGERRTEQFDAFQVEMVSDAPSSLTVRAILRTLRKDAAKKFAKMDAPAKCRLLVQAWNHFSCGNEVKFLKPTIEMPIVALAEA